MSEKQKEGVAAVGFLVMAFKDEKAGDEALKAMKEAKKKHGFYFEEAAVIVQDAESKITYKETGDMKASKGAGAGALIGGIIGVLGGPAGILAGTTAGAALGAMAAKGDAGFRDESLKMVGMGLKPGTSAVVAITSSAFLKAVQKEVKVDGIREFVSDLATKISTRLNEGKSIALGIILSETGLAIKEVAVGEDTAEVVGMAITDEGVVAGALTATGDRIDFTAVGANAEGAVMSAGTITEEEETMLTAAILPGQAEETPGEEEKPAEGDQAKHKKTEK